MVKGVAQGCRRVQQKAALQAVLPAFTSRQLRGPRFDAADTVGTELGWVAQGGEGPAPFWGGWEPRQALPWGLPGGRQALPAHWPWREQLPRRHPSRHARSPRHHVRSASRPRDTEVAGVVMSCSEVCGARLICLSVSRLCTWKSTILCCLCELPRCA